MILKEITMEIVTSRLKLVPTAPEYAESTYAYAGDLENTRLMMELPFDSLEETRATIDAYVEQWQKDKPARLDFVILKNDEHIGGMTLYFLDEKDSGELGWIVHKNHWGRGYVTEAAKAVMLYAKEKWAMQRMIACCDGENIASKRVIEKLGMHFVKSSPRKNRSSGDEERVDLTFEITL